MRRAWAMPSRDTFSVLYARTRLALLPVLTDDAIVLSFGWNRSGMGKKLGFELVELLLVCHGAAHNDTICVAERRLQPPLFVHNQVHRENDRSAECTARGGC